MKASRRVVAAAALAAAAIAHAVAAGAADQARTYDLEVSIDVPGAKLIGTATVDVPEGAELSVERGDLRILSMTNGGRRISAASLPAGTLTVRAEGPLQIHYEGTFAGQDVDVIGADKILLRGMWYPVVEGTYQYRLRATVPRTFVAVSEGDRVQRVESGGKATFSFDLPYPQRAWDGITFAASSQWVSRDAMYRDVPLSVHLLRRNAARLDETVRQAQIYLQRLESLLGKYPFQRLVIAENPVPIGYSLSMPTYILLAQESVAADSAEDSALNHEIAHAWFGNAVLADYEGGNWAEGLASYFSDHLQNERLGRGWQRRQRMMAANQSFVAGRAESPLSGFAESNDRPSKIIGYAKAALVMHMLRKQVGDERFFAAMRSFVSENLYRVASWAGLGKAFEREAAIDLRWFFQQWIEGATTPELGLENVSVEDAGDKYELRLALTQKAPALSLAVPLTIYIGGGGAETSVLRISGERSEFRYSLEGKPVRVVLDENYDVLRRLTLPEVPPMIATLLARPSVTLIGTPAEQAKFSGLAEAFEREGASSALSGQHQEWVRKEPVFRSAPPGPGKTAPRRVIARSTESSAAIAGLATSLILLGDHDPLVGALFGRVEQPHAGFSVTVLKHPRSPGDMVAILNATSKQEVDAAYESLIRHPRYSSAAFSGGKLIDYELRNGARGISAEVEGKGR